MKTAVQNRYKKQPKEKSESLFSKIDRFFRVDTSFDNGLPVRFVPYVLYFTFLGLIYIGNNHYADKTSRKISQLEEEVEDLRANYTTLKADYMFSSKQSEVARRVERLGLQESDVPPHKLIVEEK
jgi:hypothetical protein